EELPHRRNRADAHHLRIDPGDGAADEGAERLDAELTRLLLGRDHEGGGAVVDAARVARGDRAALAERRPKRRQLLGARVGPWVLVPLGAVDRDELVREPAHRIGGGPAPLSAKR